MVPKVIRYSNVQKENKKNVGGCWLHFGVSVKFLVKSRSGGKMGIMEGKYFLKNYRKIRWGFLSHKEPICPKIFQKNIWEVVAAFWT